MEKLKKNGSQIKSNKTSRTSLSKSTMTETTESIAADSSRADTISKSSSRRDSFFLIDRRISEEESQRRYSWLQKTRLSIASTRNQARLIHEVKFPDTFGGLYSAKYSPRGDLIATGFGTGAIQIRNGENGEFRTTLRSGLDTSLPVMCCRFNPFYDNIFYASSACGNIFLCMTDTNVFSRFIQEPNNEINTIDVSLDGKFIVSGGKDAALRLYDAQTAKLIHTYGRNEADLTDENDNYHRMRIFSAKFHHIYENLIITGGWDDTLRIWDRRVDSGSIKVMKGPHICGDAIDIRDTKIITGSWVVRGSLQLWDMTTAKLIETIVPENRPTSLDGEFIYAVQYFDGDPYGEHVLAGGSGTGALEVINIKDKKVVGNFEVSKAIMTIDSNRSSIIFGGMESVLRLADFS
ncbi:Similar to wdr5: WD repeat-containing protein 5 homolog (Dictyostelium discoideum) [Cotesia congregata]|uniref:Similar to wdr5: WD repeat-containing protein 5 homolog (Dictyostelium discoideum) n=1 Tax=Cotesia congregata TaxID=51543 RepID=A0A8J2HJQ4_COTCN|nr:Similar to wdr5: WD repeat-containing protein 5 homolog (Dictyostelium discoideum) [Cotesia congregata]